MRNTFTQLLTSILLAVTIAESLFAQTVDSKNTDSITGPTFGSKQPYLIIFPEPGALHYTGDIPGYKATVPTGHNKLDINAVDVIAYRQYLSLKQNQHIETIEKLLGHKLNIRHRYELIKSGIAVDEFNVEDSKLIIEQLNYTALRSYNEEVATFRGPTFIGANSVWSGMNTPDRHTHTGIGVTIGILDSGYNRSHPSFGPMPAACNGDRYGPFLKVDSAVDCSGGGSCRDSTRGDPSDHTGHGSHVGSIAAGNELPNGSMPIPSFPEGFSRMSGVAPCATLRFYKVCSGGLCPSVDILAAQEAVIADSVDVVNFSIGGGSDPWAEQMPLGHAPSTDLGFLDVAAANIVVVAAAGNTGFGTKSDPVGRVMHRGPWVLTVAASSHDQNSLVSIMPPGRQGDVLASFSLRGPNVEGTMADGTIYAGFDVTKPDIAAPGNHIYAANNRDYIYMDGTSMASPHVAGAAALIREIHPNWSAFEVMSALRLTAVTQGTKENGRIPWDADDVGNGRVDLTQATRAALVMDESALNFARANPASDGDPKTLNLPAVRNTHCVNRCSWTRRLRSGVSIPVTWTVIAFDAPNASLSVSPTTFTSLPRGTQNTTFPYPLLDEQSITITATMNSPVASDSIGFGSIVLHAIGGDGSIPDEHITVAVQGNSG